MVAFCALCTIVIIDVLLQNGISSILVIHHKLNIVRGMSWEQDILNLKLL